MKEASPESLVHLARGGQWHVSPPLDDRSLKRVSAADLAPSTVNKSSRPLLEP